MTFKELMWLVGFPECSFFASVFHFSDTFIHLVSFSEGTFLVTKALELWNLLGLCLRLLRLLLLLLELLHILHVFEACGRCSHELRLASYLLLRLSCGELLCKLH